MRFNKYTRRIDQHAFSSIIHFQLIDDCEIREFETYELNSALIQYRVQGTITIHATASLIYAERIISRVIRGWHSVNRRRVPSIIHRRASVTRMGLGSFVLSISLEHSQSTGEERRNRFFVSGSIVAGYLRVARRR